MNLLIDVPNLYYRLFFANGGEEPAYFLFINSLINLYRTSDVKIHFCFDSHISIRKDIDESYKVNRKKEIPRDQVDKLKELLLKVGASVYECEGYEADDIIYTLCHEIKGPITVVSRDQDLYACLIFDNVTIKSNKDYDREMIEKKLGIPIDMYFIYRTLVGDPSDNIKGAWQVGPVKAKNLILEEGSRVFEADIQAIKEMDVEKTMSLVKLYKLDIKLLDGGFTPQMLSKLVDKVRKYV